MKTLPCIKVPHPSRSFHIFSVFSIREGGGWFGNCTEHSMYTSNFQLEAVPFTRNSPNLCLCGNVLIPEVKWWKHKFLKTTLAHRIGSLIPILCGHVYNLGCFRSPVLMCCQIMTCISTHSPPLVNATFEWENFRPGLLGLGLLGKHMGSTPYWSPTRNYHFGPKKGCLPQRFIFWAC